MTGYPALNPQRPGPQGPGTRFLLGGAAEWRGHCPRGASASKPTPALSLAGLPLLQRRGGPASPFSPSEGGPPRPGQGR
jgi:hypothetical protein